MVKKSKTDTRKKTRFSIRNSIKSKIFLLLLVGIFVSLYSVIDYSSIQVFHENMLNKHYYIFDFCPGDGKVSSLEYYLFFIIAPIFCCLIFLDILFSMKKGDEKI